LRGVPGIYFHSLVGTANYHQGVDETNHNRTINRRKFNAEELRNVLSQQGSTQRMVFDGYLKMLAVRVAQPAFHPDADQKVIETGRKSVVAFLRTSRDREQRILILANVSGEPVRVDLSSCRGVDVTHDLLSGQEVARAEYELAAYQIAWLS
jgi:sucrose phosphorylase